MTQLTFNEKMATVQLALKVPKSANEKVPYKSRNAEEILDQVKPLLAEHGLIVTLHPHLESVEGRLFIVSTATVTDGENKASGVGIAELLTPATNSYGKSTMNESQASGATGSYANKYALGAVFGIGEAEDADHEKYARQPSNPKSAPFAVAITDKQLALIEKKIGELKSKDIAKHAQFGEWYKTSFDNKPFKKLSVANAKKVIDRLLEKPTDELGDQDPLPAHLDGYSDEVF